jgi:ATPase subunit of ABC transporter with duplicated ATPase domains
VLLVSHDRALLDAVADRLLAVEGKTITSYTGGWADYARAQEVDAAPPPPPKPKRERPARPANRRQKPPAPTALELVEREVERAEARVAELEQKLAEDWGDVELVASHKTAREDLEALLKRWETLFDSSNA